MKSRHTYSKTNSSLKYRIQAIRHFGVVAFLAIAPSALYAADTLASYTFDGGSTASSVTVTGATPGVFSSGAEGAFSPGTGTAYIQAHKTPANEADALSGANYFSFKITVDAGYSLDLESLSFATLFSGEVSVAAVNANYFAQSSATGFGSGKNVGATFSEAYKLQGSAATTRTVTLTGLPQFQGITGEIEFRIYVFDDSGAADRFVRLDNVMLTGSVSSIPEPGASAAIGGGIGLLAILALRRKWTGSTR